MENGQGRLGYWNLSLGFVHLLRRFFDGYVRGVRLLFREGFACRRARRTVELQLGVKAISFLIDRVSAVSRPRNRAVPVLVEHFRPIAGCAVELLSGDDSIGISVKEVGVCLVVIARDTPIAVGIKYGRSRGVANQQVELSLVDLAVTNSLDRKSVV